MQFDAKQIVNLINTQRSAIADLLHVHEKESVLTSRLVKLSRPGNEVAIVQLALIDDCLNAIESVLFSLNGCRNIDTDGLFKFLQPVARQYVKKAPELYRQFGDLRLQDCEKFLETHYTDGGPFGGANRRTKWSGFQLARNVDRLKAAAHGTTSYRSMLIGIVSPLLDEGEAIADVLELVGVWSALESMKRTEESGAGVVSCNEPSSFVGSGSVMVHDFCNSAILFDVVSGVGGLPQVKLNSSHKAFQDAQTLQILLQAWAEMETSAWDRRKQLIQDVRSDWGRVARDLMTRSSQVVAK